MLSFLLRRVLSALPVLLGVILIIFFTLRLIPGDPATALLFGTDASPEQIAALRERLGLNEPIWAQFWIYFTGLLRGDLGYSYSLQTPVLQEILTRFPASIELTLGALVVAFAIGVPAGIIGGLRPGSIPDAVASVFAILAQAIPYFWFASLLVLLFAVNLGWLPVLSSSGSGIRGLVLPALSLGLGYAAIIMRLLRESLIDVYRQPYMLVARAKGLSGARLLFSHGLKNASTSIITVIGLQIGSLLAGGVIIDVIFGRAGVGSLLVQQVTSRDIPTVQGVVLFIAIIYIVINLGVDAIHGIIDPRIRKGWAK